MNSYLLYPVFYFIVQPRVSRRPSCPVAANMRSPIALARPAWCSYLWRRERSERFKEYLLGGVDVVHSTTFCAPRFRARRRRLVVTIHDCTFVTHPEFHLPGEHRALSRRAHGCAIERADALIAVSESTRRDLIEWMGAPAERIVVTPAGRRPDLARVTDPARLDAVRRRYDLPERFVLFLGAMEPRKNLLRLLEACVALAGGPPRVPARRGRRPGLAERLRARARGEARTRPTACASPATSNGDDLAALYSLATVFAYPSLWEGFGLPVLEAMACGTPVLTSNVSSLPEVAGDAAVLVPPTDVDAIADGLRRLLEDAALRADLAERGRRPRGPLLLGALRPRDPRRLQLRGPGQA